MVVSRSWRVAPTLGVLAALAACSEVPAPVAPSLAPAAGLTAVAPASIGEGELWICKVGNAAGTFSFNYSLVNDLGAAGPSGTVSVDAGNCVMATAVDKVATGPSNRWFATVTENTPPAYWSLTGIIVTYTGNFTNTPIVDLPNRSVSRIRVANDLGGTATFTNAYDPPVGKLGDYVWEDLNGNGIQDSGEPGIAGVSVTLSGAASASTTTDANGFYLFSNLAAGSYTVTVTTPAGFYATASNQGGDPTLDSNGSPASVTLATNSSEDLTIDFGFRRPSGTIGDFVWEDLNGNGIQDSGEPGIAGVSVTLSGAASGSTTTDANGYYLFSGLSAGSYTVTVATPAGLYPTGSNQGGDPTLDSNGSPASVTLATNSSADLTIDFGFRRPSGKIGNFVWEDLNGNGVQDSGEPGIAGVSVTLSGAASGSTTTDANGFYLFSGLSAGSYTVTAATPAGLNPTLSNQGGNPALDSNGSPAAVTLASNSAEDLTIDFGFVRPPAQGCTYTQGYWKTHSRRGPAPYDAGWKKLGALEEATPFFNSGKTWYEIWQQPVRGSAYIQLAHQYMAAKLNVLNGASAPANVAAAIATAEQYFGGASVNITGLATLLDNYNNGLIGPGHC